MDFNSFISQIAVYLGISAAQLLFYLGLVVCVFNIIGKLIPDDAVGILGIIRRVSKILGLYVASHIRPGVTVNDAIAQQPALIRQEVSSQIQSRVIPHINRTVAETNPFKRDPATGQFQGRGGKK